MTDLRRHPNMSDDQKDFFKRRLIEYKELSVTTIAEHAIQMNFYSGNLLNLVYQNDSFIGPDDLNESMRSISSVVKPQLGSRAGL